MGMAENQDCPNGKTNLRVWIENGACDQKKCLHTLCEHHSSHHPEPANKKSRRWR